MARKGEEVRHRGHNALGAAIGHCRGLPFRIGPRLNKNSLQMGKSSLVWGAGPHGSSRVPAGFHGRFFQEVSPLENRRFFTFFGTFLRGKSIEMAGPN